MRQCAYLVALVASLFLFGCSGMKGPAAKAPETDPWADYKGTFASGVPSSAELRRANAAEAKEKGASTTTTTSAETKPADSKPTKKTAEAKPAKPSADAKPESASDARSMYADSAGDDAEPEPAPARAPKKAGKKKGAPKKAGGKKPGKSAKR
ncbi:MAG: hypothetical protein KF819_17825 [Labilithrix sp.]|nr:hypothetical protein [Labilithrix sp.]